MFQAGARGIGIVVLVLIASIGLFLCYQAIPTFRRYGFGFLTESRWLPNRDIIGLSAVIVGTFEVALIALAVGIPLAFLTALYISEYSPRRLRSSLVALVDLMAAIPAIVYGLWALFVLEPHAINVVTLAQPELRLDTDLPRRHRSRMRSTGRGRASARRRSSPGSPCR